MSKDYSITKYFGSNLAELLSKKILTVHPRFNSQDYIDSIQVHCVSKTYTQRIELHATTLSQFLPDDYEHSISIITQILGAENPNETGMFKQYYWILPLGKYVELYGLDHFKISIKAIEEITKRNTGEYAIRPYIRAYPKQTIRVIKQWAKSSNFHLRRLASEGLRPKLPWASKLDTFVQDPTQVFDILELLKEDPVKFVQKSVANHLTDYLKVNPEPTRVLIKRWSDTKNKNTLWIIKRATRKIS